MELIRILGLTFVYILILLIQIISLIIVAIKNEKNKWKKLFIFEVVTLIVALALWGLFWMIVFDDKNFVEDFVWNIWNMYGSAGASIVYGVMLAVSVVARLIKGKK